MKTKEPQIAKCIKIIGSSYTAICTGIYDPFDPMGKKFFNILATFAEF